MDVAARSAFPAAVVLPNERTAVMGVINVVKTASQSLGPLITGILARHHLFWEIHTQDIIDKPLSKIAHGSRLYHGD